MVALDRSWTRAPKPSRRLPTRAPARVSFARAPRRQESAPSSEPIVPTTTAASRVDRRRRGRRPRSGRTLRRRPLEGGGRARESRTPLPRRHASRRSRRRAARRHEAQRQPTPSASVATRNPHVPRPPAARPAGGVLHEQRVPTDRLARVMARVRQNTPATSPPNSADSKRAAATPPTRSSADTANTRSSVSEEARVNSSHAAAARARVTRTLARRGHQRLRKNPYAAMPASGHPPR